jgi:hypothetical protein
MDLNRNHFFIIGTVILFLGVQLRFVDSYVLNEPTTRFLAEKFASADKQMASTTVMPAMEMAGPGSSASLRTIRPPIWLGWALISVGGVLMLHSLAMRKP